jgi:hypothetical protein
LKDSDIKEVVIGPKLDKKKANYSINKLLEINNLKHVKVINSEIPFA